jgi:hypothetical protein
LAVSHTALILALSQAVPSSFASSPDN